ncbi:DUF5076 domain-containing protein [Lysobacter sp. FW306-1B-D06B]|uniref:DUF5076 domain-containing protein n=1 Tax=Lysobacter sp. FW306-1B-D06B TaxID=3140250 RepID=UPI00314028F1
MKPLVIPPAAQRDGNSIQMISGWIAEKGLHCSLNVGLWEAQGRNETAAWGILLADVIRHVANALEERSGLDPTESAHQILESLWGEFKQPTSEVEGGFHPGHS